MTTRCLKSKHCVLLIAILFFSTGLSTARAGEFHAPPRDFLFGNHIDTHQETKLKLDKAGNPVSLSGFFYVIFTDEPPDPVSGLPIARHPRGAAENEECGVDPIDCIAAWRMEGIPAEAKFLYHSGVNGDDHSVWLLNRVDIPQPGSFTHFHWITSTSTDPGASSVPEACDVNNAGQLENGVQNDGNGAQNVVCPGWLLEIRATKTFAFQHGGELVPVRAGIDNASHLNLVTNYADVEGITSTRPASE